MAGGPRPWSALTPAGRTRRLYALARAALGQYGLRVRRLRLLAADTNAVFAVEGEAGGRWALRVGRPGWRARADLDAEVAWLLALRRDTDVGAPVPVPNRQGLLVTTVEGAGVPARRRCLLTTWVPGRRLAADLSAPRLRQLGALAATLHRHAAAWRTPPGFSARRLDRVLARGEPACLLRAASAGAFAPGTRPLFAEADSRVARAFARLRRDGGPPRVIHHDLNQDNVHVERGRLRPLDFEDTALGHPVQDIAMTWLDLLDYTDLGERGYLLAREAFAAGYAAVAPWPEAHPGEIDAFMVGRLLWRANFVFDRRPGRAAACTAAMAPRLRRFLRGGRLVG